MICPRCGTVYEGHFCPRCGASAAPAPPAPAPAFGGACPRCGTVYQGNFCPKCGLPAAMVRYAAPPSMQRRSSDMGSIWSVLWTLTIVGVLIFLSLNFAGLLLSPSMVVPGIQSIAHGQSTNPDLSAGTAGWTFQVLGTSGSSGTYDPSGGNPGGALAISIPAAGNTGGEWVQAVDLVGGTPWFAEANLSYQVETTGSVSGRLVVSVETSPNGLDLANASAIEWVNLSAPQTTAWATTPKIDTSASITYSGTYYLKVAYLASSATGTTTVRLDNVKMAWATDAFYYFYLPLPLPLIFYASQDAGGFLGWYGFLIVALVGCAAWYGVRDRKVFIKTLTAPLDDIRSRLRSGSAWVAIAQVWMASTFFSLAFTILLDLFGVPTTSPISLAPTNAWNLIYLLTNASVFEEIAFRMFLIGVPMAAGAILLRLSRGGPRPVAPGSKPWILSALRQVWGGQLRWNSSREAKLAAGILVLVSSFLWAIAHWDGGGWGLWKVVPVFIAGLGAGYVFLRHGLAASILVHFATDGSLALYLEGVGGLGMDALTSLLEIALATAGAAFFIWYILYGWEEFQNLRRSFGTHVVRQPVGMAPPGPPPAAPPPGANYAGPSTGGPGPVYPYAPPPPPSPQAWPPPPGTQSPPSRDLRVPQGYAPTYHPAPYGFPPVRFQCPTCGWVEAKYENGHFTCLRCGRTT